MGALVQSILSGIGRTGADVAGGRLEAEDRKLKMLQSQMALNQLKQKMSTEAAPQYVGSYVSPTGQRFNTTRDTLTGALKDVAGGQEAGKGVFKPLLTENGDYVLYNDVTAEERVFKDEKGNPIKGFPKGRNGPLIINGKPGGIIRGGQPVTPDSPDWTPADAVQLANYLKTYQSSEEDKNKRIELAAKSRVEAYMNTRVYGQFDSLTNSLVSVTPRQIVDHPGRYAPPGPAVTLNNRIAVFNELDTTTKFAKDAISRLSDKDFDPAARLQLAYALRTDDPREALHAFLRSDVAATLTDDQINYVTALASLSESAMSLRTIAGIGQGSDKVRDAIGNMLPAAGTPSKAYALRQMRLFEAEVDALRTSVKINIGEPGQGGGQTVSPTKGKGTKDDPIVIQ